MGLGSYLLKQGGLAAAYLGVGYGAAAINDFKANSLRSYYGDKEYDNRFHGYLDNASALYRGLGLLGAGAAMFKADPISSIGRLSKNLQYSKGIKAYKREVYLKERALSTGAPNRHIESVWREELGSAKAKLSSLKKGKPSNLGVVSRLGIAGGLAYGAASYTLQNPAGVLIGGTALGIAGSALALGPMKAAGFGKSLLIGGGALGAGAGMASLRRPYAAAESGNSDIQHDGTSVVDRLNYSTAGLTFALHRNRRAL